MVTIDFQQLALQIKQWGLALGFQQIGITDINLQQAEKNLQAWLAQQFHGEMHYMKAHGEKRSRPDLLIPGTLRVICARLNYLPDNAATFDALAKKEQAYIARYALGRDYHKVIRKRLTKLAAKIADTVGDFGYRVFSDSAPVLEKPLAAKAGLGWQGKHTNLINRQEGSWFFLGEIYTDLPLPLDEPVKNHCGRCKKCLDICPTQAIIAPYVLDARKCISYLTIEYRGSIPENLRPLIGNRIFGCDDCQAICPWNRFAKSTKDDAFQPRHGLTTAKLTELFLWSESEFLKKTEGSALRRVGYTGWLRNIAIALGNAPTSFEIIHALQQRLNHSSSLVREHVVWALNYSLCLIQSARAGSSN